MIELVCKSMEASYSAVTDNPTLKYVDIMSINCFTFII